MADYIGVGVYFNPAVGVQGQVGQAWAPIMGPLPMVNCS